MNIQFNQDNYLFLESSPTCIASKTYIDIIDANSCDRRPESLNITCDVVFSGNIAPILTLKDSVGKLNEIGFITNAINNKTTLTLMKAINTIRNGTFFTCSVAQLSQEIQPYQCRTPTIELNGMYIQSRYFD